MTLHSDPEPRRNHRSQRGWQDALGNLCADLSYTAGQIDDAVSLSTLSRSEDAEREARTLMAAMNVMADAMMAFEKRYVRGE